jgi:hypothetical protein
MRIVGSLSIDRQSMPKSKKITANSDMRLAEPGAVLLCAFPEWSDLFALPQAHS